MKFATADLGTILRTELNSAAAGSVAVAYFNPDDTTLAGLANLPALRLVISEEFQINDPGKLELLPKTHVLRAVPTDAAAGKLHSKVFLIHRLDGTRWAMVGSANLTRQGLFSNQEASIILDSTHATDDSHLSNIEAWFETVLRKARQIDFQAAKRIFQTRARYRLQRPDATPEPREEVGASRRYWALKTTAGAYGEGHWLNFLEENVIAIGWEDLDVDPSMAKDSEIEEALRRAYPEENASLAARKIRKFVDMSVGDLVLVCRGYPPKSTADVHIHGVARVVGPFVDDSVSAWWRFKHPAAIQIIEQDLPRDIIARALNKGSLMQTIHNLDPEQFTAVVDALRDNIGVAVNV